jgi:large subunit ribosomal protein L25
MPMLSLQFTKRQNADTLHNIRSKGNVPAVFYGPKEASTAIFIKESDFKKVWKQAGESSIISLVDGSDEHEALIHEVDVHPVSGEPRHADFYVIEKGKMLQLNVPIHFEGTSDAVKAGGTLVKVLHEVEIEALPKDLPKELTIDISSLVSNDSQILAGDIKLPAGVTLLTGPEEVVASISVYVEEVEEAAAPSIADIELSVEKGKEEPAADTAEAAS